MVSLKRLRKDVLKQVPYLFLMRYRQALAVPDICLQLTDSVLFRIFFFLQKPWWRNASWCIYLFKRDYVILLSNPPLGHITTFGGHPVCCAAGLASLNVIIDENLVEKCNPKSELFKKELIHPLISEVRGEGLLLAVQLNRS